MKPKREITPDADRLNQGRPLWPIGPIASNRVPRQRVAPRLAYHY